MSTIDTTATVGERLAAAREERGLSIEQTSARTRIRPSVLYALEVDDHRACGGTVYARGHVRTLARTYGMDETRLLDEFDRVHPHHLPPLAVEAVKADAALRSTGEKSPRWFPVIVLVIVLVFLAAAVGLILPRGSQTATSAAPPTPSASARAKGPAATKPAAKAPVAGVTLVITAAKGPSWVHAASGAGQLLQPDGVLPQGGTVTVHDAQAVQLRLGNAGALQVACNGRPAVGVGNVGQVVEFTFSPTSPACVSS